MVQDNVITTVQIDISSTIRWYRKMLHFQQKLKFYKQSFLSSHYLRAMTHFNLEFLILNFKPSTCLSINTKYRNRTKLNISNKRKCRTSFTLILDLADVSRNAQFQLRERLLPWSLPTTRSSSKSHLFPTNIIGTWQKDGYQDWIYRRLCFALKLPSATIKSFVDRFLLPFIMQYKILNTGKQFI